MQMKVHDPTMLAADVHHISSPENTKTAQQSFEKPLSLRAYRLSYQYVCKLQLSLV